MNNQHLTSHSIKEKYVEVRDNNCTLFYTERSNCPNTSESHVNTQQVTGTTVIQFGMLYRKYYSSSTFLYKDSGTV